MPRNGTGTFTLVSGNPVVTGTTIESNWANTTLSDIATAMTDSLSRSGQGGMTAALRVADGTQGAPGVGFANETGSGFYRAGTGEVWAVVQGAQTLNLDANGVYVPADKTTTVDGAFVFNEAGADKDARFEGDTDANLLFVDASTDRVGVGTATPTAKLNVEGSVIINDAGADVDVRIEGDTDANLVFVDASTDRVGVGTNAPGTKLAVRGATQSKEVAVRWERSTDGAVAGGLGYFYDSENSVAVGSVTNHPLKLIVNDTTEATLTSTGLGIGTSSPSNKLTVNSGASTTTAQFTSTGSSVFLGLTNSGASAFIGADNTGAFVVQTPGSGYSTKMLVDSSGNLGLGVTPSAWSIRAAQVVSSSIANDSNDTYLTANGYFDGSWKYVNSDFAAQYYQVNGVHAWRIAGSGTAGNAISFTQAMTLDADGRLALGATGINGTSNRASFVNNVTAKGVLALQSTSTSGYSAVELYDSGGTQQGAMGWGNASVAVTGAASATYLYSTGAITFLSGGTTERARITSGGALLVGTQTAQSNAILSATGGGNNNLVFGLTNNGNSTPYGIELFFSAAAPNDATRYFFTGVDNVTTRATIRSNGGLANYQANDVNLSDRREKTNFAPAKSYLDTICAIPVQTFNYIDQSEDDPGLTLGVIAQDVQAVAPELVMESNWGTEDNPKMRLSIYQTDLQYALMKCVQELKAELDATKARLAALEAQP